MVFLKCPFFSSLLWDGANVWAANTIFVLDFYYDTYSPPYRTHSLNEVTQPSTTFLVGENYFSYLSASSNFDMTLEGSYLDGVGWLIRPRHKGRGLNWYFVDGHASFVEKGFWLKGTGGWYPSEPYEFWGK